MDKIQTSNVLEPYFKTTECPIEIIDVTPPSLRHLNYLYKRTGEKPMRSNEFKNRFCLRISEPTLADGSVAKVANMATADNEGDDTTNADPSDIQLWM